MKTKYQKMYFIFLFVLPLFLLFMCKQSTENNSIKLEISNGFYGTVDDTTRIYYGFDYQVTGSDCKIGGYAIKWGEQSWYIDWYTMKTLVPNQTYSIADTLNVLNVKNSDPVITMQAYFLNSSDSDPGLSGQYTLKRK